MDSFSWDTHVFKKGGGGLLLLRAKCVLGFIKCNMLTGGKKSKKGKLEPLPCL